jgi:hypothetical protein
MQIKKTFYSFVLLALIAFKVSATHVYAHQEDSVQVEDCELCEHAIQNQNAEFSAIVQLEVPENSTVPIAKVINIVFDGPEVSNDVVTFLFTRPPPIV